MKVKFASQIFSHIVVSGMTTLVSCNELPPSAFDTIDFIDSIDKLFDIFNSHPISSDVSNLEGLTHPLTTYIKNVYPESIFFIFLKI